MESFSLIKKIIRISIYAFLDITSSLNFYANNIILEPKKLSCERREIIKFVNFFKKIKNTNIFKNIYNIFSIQYYFQFPLFKMNLSL